MDGRLYRKRVDIMKKKKKSELAFEEGYIKGQKNTTESILEKLEKMIEEENKHIEAFPRNSKFVELRIQALEDFREKLIYTKEDGFLD
jgi:hypothetical protein